jgi:low temperature requirement protein LtrA
MERNKINLWWGPPRKFSIQFEERKISWLELFYDLVYVIAISRITQYLSIHPSLSGLLDYTYLFIMIFWGWLNGSLHHDIHGSRGLRTNLMTLWQMLIVAALVVTLNSPPETVIFNATIALMAMQLFITYLWWSVGIYDKAHRRLNRPYTFCFLVSLALLFLTLFVGPNNVRILFYLSLLLNYLPPFLADKARRKETTEFKLSSSMTERLGLFSIILFGEVVLGVINGVGINTVPGIGTWINFGLSILIVFALWWIFFSMIADRKCKSGFRTGNLMAITFIPAFMALGVLGASFAQLFNGYENAHWIKTAFGVAIGVFLFAIARETAFLEYPTPYQEKKRSIVLTLVCAGVFFVLLAISPIHLSLPLYLLTVLGALLAVIAVISKSWLMLELTKTD